MEPHRCVCFKRQSFGTLGAPIETQLHSLLSSLQAPYVQYIGTSQPPIYTHGSPKILGAMRNTFTRCRSQHEVKQVLQVYIKANKGALGQSAQTRYFNTTNFAICTLQKYISLKITQSTYMQNLVILPCQRCQCSKPLM